MNTDHASLSSHPAPHRERVGTLATAFGLLGGPLAWFCQSCAGYALSSWPCFPTEQRFFAPPAAYSWSSGLTAGISIAAVVVALLAAWVSWNAFRRTQGEAAGDHRHALEAGTGRTRFLALWGLVVGITFAVVAAFTGLSLVMLPRCLG
jgi:hypothetical protein